MLSTLAHYEILEKLGQGGMGVVYRARDTRLEREVALKVLPAETSASPDSRRRFLEEARAASTLNHPNVVTIYDVRTDGDVDSIAMEYVRGETLDRLLKKQPLARKDLIHYATQIADALSAAHAAGIIHRDLKPANVMITPQGVVKLLDFGLAKRQQSSAYEPSAATATIEGMLVGTAAYMSPEQAENRKLDARSDIFSFGVVLYEMATGKRAFEGESVISTLAAILRVEYKPLSESDLDRVVSRCLAKNPADRFQSMAEVKAMLEEPPSSSRIKKLKAIVECPSIAVLPFANMSADPEQEYFCDGITEEILNALAKIDCLKVASRTSAFRFKGKGEDIAEVGRQLRVKTVLEGSVRKAGNRIRITAQLIDVANGYHLWSERYDRDISDVFAVQDEISQAITAALRIKLAAVLCDVPARRPTESIDAYNLYLKGMYFNNKRSADGLRRGLECFEQAVAADPEYAPAYAGIGESYGLLLSVGALPPAEAFPKAKAAMLKALDLDDTLANAHSGLGSLLAMYERDWVGAEESFQRALVLNSGDSRVHLSYAVNYLAPRGRLDDALAAVRRALEVDPLSVATGTWLGVVLYYQGRYAEAVAQLRSMIEFDPTFAGAHWRLALAYERLSRFDEAIVEYEKARSLDPDGMFIIAFMGALHARLGNRDQALQHLAELEQFSRSRYVPAMAFGLIYLALGEMDRALECCAKGYEERSPWLNMLAVDPHFAESRRDPRIGEFMRKIGLDS
jgi:serine/threonine protein kinase/Flp pilus assembly protein TadD